MLSASCLHRPLDKKSLQKLNKKVNATLAPNTQGNYEQYISVFKVSNCSSNMQHIICAG